MDNRIIMCRKHRPPTKVNWEEWKPLHKSNIEQFMGRLAETTQEEYKNFNAGNILQMYWGISPKMFINGDWEFKLMGDKSAKCCIECTFQEQIKAIQYCNHSMHGHPSFYTEMNNAQKNMELQNECPYFTNKNKTISKHK